MCTNPKPRSVVGGGQEVGGEAEEDLRGVRVSCWRRLLTVLLACR